MGGYHWKPIEDLPSDWPGLASRELAHLGSIWADQADRLKTSDAFKRFNEKLRREWAIETGIIENLYTIDRGITVLLIEEGIDATLIPHGATNKPSELVVSLVRDQEEALEGVFDFVSRRRELSNSFLKELHQLFTRHQDTVRGLDSFGRTVNVPISRGDWKRLPNNPSRPNGSVHEYCPPEHVASEMDRLIEMHAKHREDRVPPEIEAAWLHHRFTQIHPFQDGNGRLARAMSSMVFIREGWFPLVVNRDMRGNYIASLESADQGDLEPLVGIFVGIEKRAFLRALSISEDVLKLADGTKQILEAAAQRLQTRKQQAREDLERVFGLSRNLQARAFQELETIADRLNDHLRKASPDYWASVEESSGNTEGWFRNQIIQQAREFGYRADTNTYRAWLRLKIKEDRQVELVISFHAVGFTFSGVMAASPFLLYRDRDEEGRTAIDGPYSVCKEIFQFYHTETQNEVIARFEKWLRDVIMIGLDEWRRQL